MWERAVVKLLYPKANVEGSEIVASISIYVVTNYHDCQKNQVSYEEKEENMERFLQIAQDKATAATITALTGVVIAPVIGLLAKGTSFVENGIGNVFGTGIQREVEKINDYLTKIHDVIQNLESFPLMDRPLKKWVGNLKHAVHDANNILDEYATANRLQCLGQPKTASKLNEVGKRLEAIELESRKFRPSATVLKWKREFKECRDSTISSINKSEVFGRDEARKKIINLMLTEGGGHEQEPLPVIPILGMGGVGKTTLAQLVFNDEDVQNHFEIKMWVCVSDDFNVTRLGNKIIERATGNPSIIDDTEQLNCCLRRELSGRRFLLVLDDVWNEDRKNWDRLRDLLICGGSKSRIIVTTRSPIVASIMSKIEPHDLECLSDDDSWSLFSLRAFRNQREAEEHPNLVAIGREIVKKCKGNPLAVKSLGSLMGFKERESNVWQSVRESDLWSLDDQNVHGILPALKLSYQHLKPQLQKCFAFCAIFPRDFRIEKKQLIHLWMASDLVSSSENRLYIEDIGIEIFNELAMRSFFQDFKTESTKFDHEWITTTTFTMHDLFHDLARLIMGDECCIVEKGKPVNLSNSARHLSFYNCSPEEQNSLASSLSKAKPTLSTFLVFDTLYEYVLSPHDLMLYNHFRVLEMCRLRVKPWFPFLGNFRSLRYLDLSTIEIDKLPKCVTALYNLQTLKLRGCAMLSELPKDLSNLINLRCLDIKGCKSLFHMPAKMGRLSHLQELSDFIVGGNSTECSVLGELECLNLRESLTIKSLERVAYASDARRAKLSSKRNLRQLCLQWSPTTLVGEEVLEGLEPHQNLEELQIIGYGGDSFPTWMSNKSFTNLVKINLVKCLGCSDLPPLGQLPLLKFLYINVLRVENIDESFYGDGIVKGFPSLKELNINMMRNLEKWSELKGTWVFPSLVRLNILGCAKLTTMPHFPHLKYMDLKATPLLPIISSEKCASLEQLKISGCENLKSLPMGLQNLNSMTLSMCNHLSFSGREIRDLTSLKKLHINSCDVLVSSAEGFQYLTALSDLHIEECKDFVLSPDVIRCFSSLQRLTIRNCPMLHSFPEGFERLTALQSLHITEASPELNRRCKENGEDWDKIKNIPDHRISLR